MIWYLNCSLISSEFCVSFSFFLCLCWFCLYIYCELTRIRDPNFSIAFLFGTNGKMFKPRKDIVEGTHQVQCGQECYENQFCETSVSPLIVNCLSLITDIESSWRCIQHELLRHAAETLGTGNMRQAVALPAGVDLDEWVGKYISESFEWISGYLRRFQSKRTNGLARRGVRSLA